MTIHKIKYSIIIPVYNRPEEIKELLESLTAQSQKKFEIIVVEDGSIKTCREIVARFEHTLTIRYLFKENSGPGPSRNAGFSLATGDYFIVFDSDCIVPSKYIEIIDRELQKENWDAWGGPDRAHKNFTILQQAMGHTMSSLFTTGGIRGNKKRVGWFQPRSFNMGMSREVYERTGGFLFDRYAEDIELSIRIRDAGFKIGLIEDAFVYHKRRTNLKQFFWQVYNFGKGRVLIGNRYPNEVRLTHWVPTFFVLMCVCWVIVGLFSQVIFTAGLASILSYLTLVCIQGAVLYKNIYVGILSVPAALVQLIGYGSGFLVEKINRIRRHLL